MTAMLARNGGDRTWRVYPGGGAGLPALPEPQVKDATESYALRQLKVVEAERDLLVHRLSDLLHEMEVVQRLRYDPDALLRDADRELRALGVPVARLTPTEYRIAAMLLPLGELRNRDTILSTVWGPEWLDAHHLLRVNIARLRAKVRCVGLGIVVQISIGYRMVALNEEALP